MSVRCARRGVQPRSKPHPGNSARRRSRSYPSLLRRAITEFLPLKTLRLMPLNKTEQWVPRYLALVAIFMALGAIGSLASRFEWAWQAVVSMHKGRRRPGRTKQGFDKALRQQSPTLLQQIILALREAVIQLAGPYWKQEGFVLVGVDGSRFECPMTKENEGVFGTAGKNKTGPQQFVTTIFHVGTGLIWDWRRGAARASERGHLLEMLPDTPQQAMILADAGFTGYEVMKAIIESGRHFLIRVGSHVKLLKKLGWAHQEHQGIVYLWPKRQQKKKHPPLTLRLIRLRGARNKRMHLLTNVLDEQCLSDQQTARIYSLRWGVELIYRALKQTMNHRRLNSDTPENAKLELEWAMVAFWLMGLMAVKRLMAGGKDPRRWSAGVTLTVLRQACAAAIAGRRGPGLERALAEAQTDAYPRQAMKKSRHWPHKKREKPPGKPEARNATRLEIQLAKEVMQRCLAA